VQSLSIPVSEFHSSAECAGLATTVNARMNAKQSLNLGTALRLASETFSINRKCEATSTLKVVIK